MTEWDSLRKFTQARVGIGRSGFAVPTAEHLQFQFDHAQARDAIHWPWNIEGFRRNLKLRKVTCVQLRSSVESREQYLKRPDLGRQLRKSDTKLISSKNKIDIALIVSNGLSSNAVHQHGEKFVLLLRNELIKEGFRISPVYAVENGRVAISDEVGVLAKAKMALILIGERPGLSAVDSLAAYFTYGPKVGNSDALRNCVSNIRPPNGLSYSQASDKLIYLIKEAFKRKISGVLLKDDSDAILLGG